MSTKITVNIRLIRCGNKSFDCYPTSSLNTFKFVLVKISLEYALCDILCVDIFENSFKQRFLCAYS